MARALCALLRVCVSGLARLKLFGLEASPWLCGVGRIPALTRTRSATELPRPAAVRGKTSPRRRDYLVRRLVDGTLDFGMFLRFVVGSSVGSSVPPSDPCRCL